MGKAEVVRCRRKSRLGFFLVATRLYPLHSCPVARMPSSQGKTKERHDVRNTVSDFSRQMCLDNTTASGDNVNTILGHLSAPANLRRKAFFA